MGVHESVAKLVLIIWVQDGCLWEKELRSGRAGKHKKEKGKKKKIIWS